MSSLSNVITMSKLIHHLWFLRETVTIAAHSSLRHSARTNHMHELLSYPDTEDTKSYTKVQNASPNFLPTTTLRKFTFFLALCSVVNP